MHPALDQLLFVVFPYAAVLVCAVGVIERYRTHRFSITSQSSQFLENRQHFWGVMPFHFGILAVIAGHAVALTAPGFVLRWNSQPVRLYVGEVAFLACGVLALGGLVALAVRRAANGKLRIVTSAADWAIVVFLVLQIAAGVALALRHSWGSSWFALVATPYLWSLARFNPDPAAIAALPLIARVHIIGAFVLVAVFPYSRLMHVLAVPNPYLWRPPQVVRWYERPQAALERRS